MQALQFNLGASVPLPSVSINGDHPQIPSKPEDLEDGELDSLQEELSTDYDIGFAIKDQIIPRAVEW
jgi:nucleosome assembly protein 1-like 1